MSDEPAAAAAITVPASLSATQAKTLGRLTRIEIQNYRAYRGSFCVDLPRGENLLVYGENGAGKSSLYHTLRVFLEAPDYFVVDPTTQYPRPLAITDHRHRFTADAPAIKLQFGGSSFEWSQSTNDTAQGLLRLVNQGKGFFDYKALLGVHYAPLDQGISIELFPLIIARLLPYYTYPHRGQTFTFQGGWKELQSLLKRPWYGPREERFLEDLTAFNAALERTIHDLGTRASLMLSAFGDEFAVDFHFENAEFRPGPKRIVEPRILARPAFRKQQFPDYSSFFNEARLSALGICLFFAALKQSPATGLRILALDDILIGLDMGNRLKVVDLLHEHFADWQILIFTYSKAWFERLKTLLRRLNWAAPWENVALWEAWRSEENSPRIVAEGSGDLLESATQHLQRKDYKAAAVYARSALEALCHRTCAKAGLPVKHVEQIKERKLEDYLVVLEKRLSELTDAKRYASARELIMHLREAQSFVLNQNSHFDVEEEDTLSGEVQAAIKAVKDLAEFLSTQSWKRSNFREGKVLSAAERVSILLVESRKLVATRQLREGLRKLGDAHQAAWEAYGQREAVCLPIGGAADAKRIWDAAVAQIKLDAGLDAQLKTARPYLFGSIEDKDFDGPKFEEVAKLLERLTG